MRGTLAALTAATLLALAACSSAEPTPSVEPESTLEPGAQRIVFVDEDNAIFTVGRDGNGLRRVIGGAAAFAVALRQGVLGQGDDPRYYWPTWSPGGESLALSRTPGTEPGSPASLVVLDSDDPSGRTIHQTPGPQLVFVARDAPHYAQWSPNGRFVSFVAAARTELRLFVAAATGESLDVIADQAPLYHMWAPDSSYVLVHRIAALFRYDVADARRVDLDGASLRYRVPSISHDGSRIAYVAEQGGVARLTVSGPDGADAVTLAEVDGSDAVFAWSPAEDLLAYAARAPQSTSYVGLQLLSLDGEVRQLVEEPIVAFFWSPDGRQIALASAAGARSVLQWVVIDVGSGKRRLMTEFVPSADYVTLLSFFDQYTSSHGPWSADSRHLIFAGTVPAARDDRRQPRVYVVDTQSARVSPIERGELAFWVPPTAD